MDGRRLLVPTAVIMGALFMGGCYKAVIGPEAVPAGEASAGVRISAAGQSLEGRVINMMVMGEGGDTTLVLAAIHGNEPVGIPLARELGEYFEHRPELLTGRKVVVIPCVNPDGVIHNTRLNADAVDLNRDFGASENPNEVPRMAFSEPESRVIRDVISEYRVNRIISIHQLTDTGPEGLVHRVPKGCIDYDGPAEAVAGHMARHCVLAVQKLGTSNGSLGWYAENTLGIPCVTMELPMDAQFRGSRQLWLDYGKGIVAGVIYPESPK